MRKFIITVLFCLGLFVVHHWALSQEDATAIPSLLQVEAEAPQVSQPPMMLVFPEEGAFPTGMPMGMPGMGNPMMGGDPRFADRMRTQLTMQYREISQLLSRVDPQDTQFIETLRQEQALILEQLKNLETPATPNTRSVGTPPPGIPGLMEQGTMLPPPGVQRVNDPRDPFSQMSSDELAMLIQQAQASRQTQFSLPYPQQGMGGMNAMPPSFGGGTPNFATPVPQPRESFSVPPQAGMPWGTAQSSQEITELKETVSALQQQIGQMRDEIKALENQMRLLNQNILHMMNSR